MPPTILNLAHHGDAAVDEMSLPKQERMISVLSDPLNGLDGKPDAILFSAGGNDIAGDQFSIFLDFNDGRAAGLNVDRFTKALGSVEACYLDLFALRDRMAPGVPIFGHCYDFPIPNGAHPACAGPWLKPSLDFCNWSVAQGTTIVRDALAAFRLMQKRLVADPVNNFHLVETQDTLTRAEWANELHPVPGGSGRSRKSSPTRWRRKTRRGIRLMLPGHERAIGRSGWRKRGVYAGSSALGRGKPWIAGSLGSRE